VISDIIFFYNDCVKYSKEWSENTTLVQRHAVDQLARGGGALRPSPTLRLVMEGVLSAMERKKNYQQSDDQEENDHNIPYLTLHAQVEPDMQQHY